LSGEALVERVRHVAARLGIDPQRLLNAPAIDITAGSPYGPTAQLAAIDAQTIDAEVVDEPDGDSGL
jgi:hypothetical protein